MRLKEAELREASLAAQVRWYEEKKTGFGNVKHDFFSKQETKKIQSLTICSQLFSYLVKISA